MRNSTQYLQLSLSAILCRWVRTQKAINYLQKDADTWKKVPLECSCVLRAVDGDNDELCVILA